MMFCFVAIYTKYNVIMRFNESVSCGMQYSSFATLASMSVQIMYHRQSKSYAWHMHCMYIHMCPGNTSACMLVPKENATFLKLSYQYIYIMSTWSTYVYDCSVQLLIVMDGEHNHSMGVQWTGLPHSPKIKSDCLIKDNLVCYCPKTFETAKGKEERWCRRESNPGCLA